MRFAPPTAHVDCSPLLARADFDGVANALVGALSQHGFAIARIGRLRLDEDSSRQLAAGLMERVWVRLVAAGAPTALRLEIDHPQTTYVPEWAMTRTLLPHHDGQHCSFLTPSRQDVPDFDPSWRTFGDRGYTTTPAHKLYQGIFIADPGEGLSVTTYYDLLSLIDDTRPGGDGRRGPVSNTAVTAAARWLDGNLARARELQVDHGCVYPSLGAVLGSPEEAFHALSFHHAERALSAAQFARYPQLRDLVSKCPCDECDGDVARVYCHMLVAVTGLDWPQFRHKYEVLAPTERFDIVLGDNITLMHGGWAGGRARLLEPLCMVLDVPAGDGYESWLAQAWRRPRG
jgi:hypothetical protein